MDEIIALAQKRLSAGDRRGIREAIAEVQSGAMPSLAKPAECGPGQLPLLEIHRNESNPRGAR